VDAVTTTSRSVPGSADPVKAVSVISTETVRIRPEQLYGTPQPLYWWLLASRKRTPPRLINVYVIGHARPRSHRGLDVAAGPLYRQAFATARRGYRLQNGDPRQGRLPGVGNRRRLAASSRQVLALAQQQPGPVVLPPTIRQPLGGCWTTDTGNRDGNLRRHLNDGFRRRPAD
jgi:hypothetical protein